jgi:hypothetical protein
LARQSLLLPKERRKTKLVSFKILFLHFHKDLTIYLDPLSKFLNGSDVDLINRARDVIANSVMAEIAKEDPQGNTEYQDAIRHQIVAFFQRIRLSLLVLDTLMEAFNDST